MKPAEGHQSHFGGQKKDCKLLQACWRHQHHEHFQAKAFATAETCLAQTAKQVSAFAKLLPALDARDQLWSIASSMAHHLTSVYLLKHAETAGGQKSAKGKKPAPQKIKMFKPSSTIVVMRFIFEGLEHGG